MTKGLLTTAVGSYPKPDYITKARAQFLRGDIGAEELEELEKQATAHWIQVQEDVGMDVVVDGEMYRGDMVAYFAENMAGLHQQRPRALLRQSILPQAHCHRPHWPGQAHDR